MGRSLRRLIARQHRPHRGKVRTRMRSLLTSVALTAALVVAIPATSRAQDAEDAEITKMAKEHYRLGVEAYKAGKYAEAVKELKKAYLLKRLPPILSQIAKT